MALLPIFIIGCVIGAGATALVMANVKHIPSVTKLSKMENIIVELKEDISILENENKELREKSNRRSE